MSDKKPIIVYVDDESRNLSLLQVILDEEQYDLKLYENGMDALKELRQVDPWVIVTDQRMPGMSGLEFLEVAAQLVPEAPRIIITGQTDEDTMLKLVRRARLYDYITKPVMEDDVVSSIKKAVAYSKSRRELAHAIAEKDQLNKELLEKTKTLEQKNKELEEARKSEIELRKEAEAWSSVGFVKSIKEQKLHFPIKRDLTCITYDIVKSSELHGKTLEGQDLRVQVLNLFTSALLKFGGIQECHGGDAAFGHFGAFSEESNSATLALAVAQEFRLHLRNLTRVHGIKIECGIAISYTPDALVNVHEVHVQTHEGDVVKKFLSSTSPYIDNLFRLEKLTHKLPGTNIIMTEQIAHKLPANTEPVLLGVPKNIGSLSDTNVYIIKSDKVTEIQLKGFSAEQFVERKELKRSA